MGLLHPAALYILFLLAMSDIVEAQQFVDSLDDAAGKQPYKYQWDHQIEQKRFFSLNLCFSMMNVAVFQFRDTQVCVAARHEHPGRAAEAGPFRGVGAAASGLPLQQT